MLENIDPPQKKEVKKIRSFLIQLISTAQLFIATAVVQWTKKKWKFGIKNDDLVPEVVDWVFLSLSHCVPL